MQGKNAGLRYMFLDFRGWLISRGRTVFEKVIADPDSLADDPEDRDGPLAEVWSTLIHDVYEAKPGQPLPPPGAERTDRPG
jgi:uncharacterized protein DUF4240